MVLGISTIIMFVVLICVGYEKLINNSGKNCYKIVTCRKKLWKKKRPPSSVSPEPLVKEEEEIQEGIDNAAMPASNNIRY